MKRVAMAKAPTNPMSKTEQTLRQIVSDHLGVPESEVTRDALFADDLGADSLDFIEIVMECEDAFKVDIDEDAASGFTRVGQLLAYLERRVAETKGAAT